EPNNSGIVLNVSEGGLCFHSVDFVQRESTVRFSLALHNQRIEAAGEVAWMDETGRTGGLRFTDVPSEIREEIRRLVSQPRKPIAANEATPQLSPSLRSFPVANVGAETKVNPAGSSKLTAVSQELTARAPLRGFTGGLAVGLIVSALITAA